MNDCKEKCIPCDITINNILGTDSEFLQDISLYQEIIGSLIYLMTCTRPDLSYIVTKLS